MTAKQKILAGTIVLTEKPLFIQDWVSNESVKKKNEKKVLQLRALSMENNEKIFRLHGGPTELINRIARLCIEEKKELFQFPHSLRERVSVELDDSESQREDEIHLIKSIDKILGKNAFGNELYDAISRFNHACDSNAQYSYTRPPDLLHVQACRDIQEGEEVTICYVDPDILTEDERKTQVKQWDFICDCNWCGNESEARARHQNERIRLYLAQRDGPTEENVLELHQFASQNIKDMENRGQCGLDLASQYTENIILNSIH